ncbi:hypothetical protein K1T71_013344 [Dendrolimus kikuchii]|uniref:Uncharacterized protein n=1 Tax=Dendrolimus kikuchii TaxID=765133 RepID=A0ACC1CHZ3_9NEOP|nr:hypothetical protein K1T71_013344 [Dendrolimus kikuchii]
MTDENLSGKSQQLLAFASENSIIEKRRNKPAEYKDYALKIYKQPEDIINTKFDNAMQFVIPSVKKLDLVPLVTVNKIRRFTGASHGETPCRIRKTVGYIRKGYVTDLAKDFNTPTVFVYDKSKYHNERVCEVPNLRALKVDLMKWLDMHNIPYDPEANKYHLYELTQKYVDIDEDLFKADIILEAQGHIVLRIPNCIKELCPGYFFAKAFQDHINSSGKVCVPSGSDETVTRNLIVSPEPDGKNLKAYDEAFMAMVRFDVCNILKLADISGHEIKMLERDIKIDSIMDEVRAKCYQVSEESDTNDLDSELPSCSDSD